MRRGLFYSAVVKRAGDLTGSALLLAAVSPFIGLAALAIKLDDGGPVFFHQKRLGRDGRPFNLHKLRTMRVGTEQKYGGYPTADAVSRPGEFLRRTSLDELPQLWNILRGEMSFVGPRPAPLSHLELYTPDQRRRLSVLPGVTGLAQVEFRNNATWSRRIVKDLEYIDGISLRVDLGILLRTIPVVVHAKGQTVGQTAAEVNDLGSGSR